MGVLASLERTVFAQLNGVLEPRVRDGWISPGIVPAGLVVLETRGRRTGLRRRVPLAALRLGKSLLVATFRGGRSDWIRNVKAEPSAGVWIGGQREDVRALVLDGSSSSLPDAWAPLAAALAPWACAGWAFALLLPSPEPAESLAALAAPARP